MPIGVGDPEPLRGLFYDPRKLENRMCANSKRVLLWLLFDLFGFKLYSTERQSPPLSPQINDPALEPDPHPRGSHWGTRGHRGVSPLWPPGLGTHVNYDTFGHQA